MKKRELSQLGLHELSALAEKLRVELAKHRIQKSVGSVENPLVQRAMRRTLARALTLAKLRSQSTSRFSK